jgi:uncharacterized protein (DUF305 family)
MKHIVVSTLMASLGAVAVAASLTGGALAQAPDHHPGATPPAAAQPAPPASQPPAGQPPMQMMQMPEQCRAMMQNMPQGCMGMMMQMMQGGMMRPGASPGSPAAASGQSEATTGYLAAMDKMHGPMMEGVKAADPDVAFVRGMIPHHQGAIDMARVVLKYGKDEQARKWAEDVIRQQQREIDEMQAWLAKRQ